MSFSNVGCEVAPAEGGDSSVRILHRLDVQEGPTGEGAGKGPHVGLVLDLSLIHISEPTRPY